MKKCIALLLTGVMLLGLLSGCNTYQNDDSASSAGSTSNTADGRTARRLPPTTLSTAPTVC